MSFQVFALMKKNEERTFMYYLIPVISIIVAVVILVVGIIKILRNIQNVMIEEWKFIFFTSHLENFLNEK